MPSPSQIRRARNACTAYLTGHVTITRNSTPASFDPGTGSFTAGSSDIVWSGNAGIGDRTDTDTNWAAQPHTTGQLVIRAPLDAHDCQPGDLVTIDDPGDYPGTDRHLWIHHIDGRSTAVLARLVCTRTQPGAD